MKLSEKILSLRTAGGLSQGDLAEKLEVSRQSVSKWETGQSAPDLDKIIKIADLFGVTTDYLLREGEEKTETLLRQEVACEVKTKESGISGAVMIGALAGILGIGLILIAVGKGGRMIFFLGVLCLVVALPLLLMRRFHWSMAAWLTVGITAFYNPLVAVALAICIVALMHYEEK